MLGFYLFAAILGGGLLVFSLAGDADHGHDTDAGDHAVGELLLGFFRPRNLIFLLAAFGATGALLTALGRSAFVTALFAGAMGLGAMTLSHFVFTWLRKNDSAKDVLDDADLEGLAARVVLPIAPGAAGRVVCVVGGREQYLTARLTSGQPAELGAGRDVVIMTVANGVAEVSAFDALTAGSTEDTSSH
jgi:hypothetical protein